MLRRTKRAESKTSGEGYINHVRENFLEAMEIPLLAGRTLRAQDDARAPKVVVVNQTFAETYFPNENPIGKRFTFASNKPDEIEIVGLAKDAKYTRQRDEIPPTVYLPWRQELRSMSGATLEVRTEGDLTAVVAAVRQAARAVDENLPLDNIRTQIEQAEETSGDGTTVRQAADLVWTARTATRRDWAVRSDWPIPSRNAPRKSAFAWRSVPIVATC